MTRRKKTRMVTRTRTRRAGEKKRGSRDGGGGVKGREGRRGKRGGRVTVDRTCLRASLRSFRVVRSLKGGGGVTRIFGGWREGERLVILLLVFLCF